MRVRTYVAYTHEHGLLQANSFSRKFEPYEHAWTLPGKRFFNQLEENGVSGKKSL